MEKIVILLFVCLCVKPVFAELIVIEADDYEIIDNQVDMSPIFPQFDFITCGSGNTIYAVKSVCGYGQLGENVLGCAWHKDYWSYPSELHIKIIDGLAKSVSLLVHESTEAIGNVYVWLKVCDSSNMVLEEAYIQAPNTDHPPAMLSIIRDDYDIARAEIYMPGGGGSICLDHIEILLNPKQTLTMQTEPNYVDTVEPNTIEEHIYHLDTIVNLSASAYPNCPDSLQFHHWEGDVRDPCSKNTVIVMDANEVVTAYFVPAIRQCGDICHPIQRPDLNQDCYINLEDFAIYAQGWLRCNHPDCD